MKIPRARSAWFAAGLALLAAALAGCNPASSTDAQVLELVAPGLVDSNAVELAAGASVEIRWTPGNPDFPVWLVYRDRTSLSEEVILTDAMGGTTTWVVPTTLSTVTAYEIREYDPQDGTLLALSPPLQVTGADATSTGLPAGSACTSDAECDDSLYCTGVETCAGGFCSNGVAPCASGLCDEATDACLPTPCATDDNCAADEACADHVCIALNPGSNGLAGYAFYADSGDAVDFGQTLTVGDALNLQAPQAAVATARILDGACSCGWSIQPPGAGTFSAANACSTGFTLASSNAFELIVDTYCAGNALRYVQAGIAADPPPATPSMEVLAEETVAPYVVRFTLRLKDTSGAVIPDGVSVDDFQIVENGTSVDFSETNRFVVPGANLPLRIVLVLDYTSSMAASGAIGTMIASAAELVQADHFTATHQFGVVEFHDRTPEGEGYRLVVPLTAADAAGKTALVAGLPRAAELEGGLSRVWDAVNLALTTLGAVERQADEVQAVVFLTDGRDTTSDAAPAALIDTATAGGVALYPIGFGDVADTEALLRNMATSTGGTYFAAADADALRAVFARIAADLRGQWNLSYVTPRNSGSVKVDLTFNWQGRSANYATSFDAGSLTGDIHQGRITVLDRSYNPYTDRTSFVLHALYIPRNIDRFRFVFAHSDAQFALQAEGGLTPTADGWSLTPTGSGGYLLLNPTPLEYGAFGNIGTVTVPGEVATLQVVHDDTLYDTAPQPKSFVFEGDLWTAPYTLAVQTTPEGLGQVLVSPAKDGYGAGETVTLTAIAAAGASFKQWTGNATGTTLTVDVVMDDDKSVVAEFAVTP
ncbi:MAG TPA: VWA domain-containing protein [Phycisphaerae bacterium]|nr:VWA domain-containing protein [Phycisphaerales bacterium]HRX83972.1 VWA domain-containing protein [Phycisphaerae bacterium]